MKEFPKIKCVPIVHIDATPNEEYPIRILKAYRENCKCKWSSNSDINNNLLFELMNEDQDKRVAILDEAIKILEEVFMRK